MKNILTIVISALLLLIVGCKDETVKPKVIYEDAKEKIKPVSKDTSKIKIADLPIQIEGTKYLLHVIGDVRIAEDSKSYGSSKNAMNYILSNYNRYELTGYFEGIKFQHQDSLAVRSLSEKEMRIETVTFLNTIANKTKKQILVYTLEDMDSNKDGKLDQNDIKDLYISDISGNNFVKLSKDFQELIDWNVVESQNRIYFRTIEDINKNGDFDNKDKVNYQFVNLLQTPWKVEEYSPF